MPPESDAGGKKRIFSVNSKMPTVVSRYDAGNPRNVGVGAPNGGGVSDNGGDVSRYGAGVGRQFLPGGGGKALPPGIAPGARLSPAAAGWEDE